MTKDTTDELTTARLYDNRFNRFDDELINKYFNDEGKKSIEKYISNRDKLARIDEGELLTSRVQKAADTVPPNLLLDEMVNIQWARKDELAALRKELDGEQSNVKESE